MSVFCSCKATFRTSETGSSSKETDRMSRRVDALRTGLRGLNLPQSDLLVVVDEVVMVEDSESSEETLLAMEGR